MQPEQEQERPRLFPRSGTSPGESSRLYRAGEQDTKMDRGGIIGGVFLLILLYLFLANSAAVNNILNSLGVQGEANIRALQGRA